jgi:outer membrane protein TolC
MKMKINRFVLLPHFLVFAAVLQGQNWAVAQSDLSLNLAIEKAMANNFGIRIADNQAEIAERNNTWGEAGAYPSINLLLSNGNAIADQTNNPTAFIREKLQSNSLGASASLDWTIFGGFRVRTTKEKLELISQLSDGNADLVLENTIQAVIVSYYAVLLEQERLSTLGELATLSSDRRAYMRKRKELGVSGTFESLAFESAALNDSTTLLLQQQQVRNAARNLNLVMAEPVESKFNLVDELLLPGEQQEFNVLLNQMQQDNRNLRNQAINKAIAERDAKLAKSPMYPALNFSAGFADTRSQFKAGELQGDGETINYFGNFTIGFNLFNGGKTRRAIQNAQVLEEIAQLNYEQINRNLSADLSRAFEQFQDQLNIYKLTSNNVDIAKTRLELSEDRFERGLISSLEYRDAQLAYLNASLQATQSLYALNVANLDIKRLCGNITEGLN